MPNISNFPEDMLPREYPKIKQQHIQNTLPMPMPTLPVISLIFDDEDKDCAIESPEPESLTQFKRKNVVFVKDGDSTKYSAGKERRSVKSAQRTGRPELDLTLYESPNHAIENKCSLKQQPRSKECRKEISCNDGNKIARAYFSVHVGKQEIQARKSNGFVVKENSEVCHRMISNQNTCAYRMQDNSITAQLEESVTEQKITDVKQKTMKKQKEKVNDETLAGIVKDQQQHILIQQKQIWLQQKQNLIQQNQIFALQHKIQELLLEKENIDNKSLVCEKTTCFMLNECGNSIKNMRTTSTARSSSRATKSVGHMTNSLTTRNPILRDKPTSQFEPEPGNSRFMSSAKYMHSSRIAENLFCESPNRNDGSTNERRDIERSFAFYKESMDYCQESAASLDTDESIPHRNKMSSNITDQVSVAMTPSAYDYLLRHRLLEDMNELDEHKYFHNN